MDKKGNYILKSGKAFGPAKPKWSYTATNKSDFFAGQISGCQRLPNGNTLICDGTSGIFFEVTSAGTKTWEYVCPVDGNGPMEKGDSIPLDHRGHAMNAVFKIERYPLDYPGFNNRDLTPKGKVTGSKPENVPENLSRGGGGERRGGEGSGERRGTRGSGGDQRCPPQEIDRTNKAADEEALSTGLGRSTAGRFTVSSPVVKEGEALPVDFTGDGDGISMPVEWSGAPAGTQCFALNLWYVAPDREKSYWVVYNIPADVHALPEDARGVGTVGYNDQGRSEYMSMRSKGGGVKEYNLTIYALECAGLS